MEIHNLVIKINITHKQIYCLKLLLCNFYEQKCSMRILSLNLKKCLLLTVLSWDETKDITTSENVDM